MNLGGVIRMELIKIPVHPERWRIFSNIDFLENFQTWNVFSVLNPSRWKTCIFSKMSSLIVASIYCRNDNNVLKTKVIFKRIENHFFVKLMSFELIFRVHYIRRHMSLKLHPESYVQECYTAFPHHVASAILSLYLTTDMQRRPVLFLRIAKHSRG